MSACAPSPIYAEESPEESTPAPAWALEVIAAASASPLIDMQRLIDEQIAEALALPPEVLGP